MSLALKLRNKWQLIKYNQEMKKLMRLKKEERLREVGLIYESKIADVKKEQRQYVPDKEDIFQK